MKKATQQAREPATMPRTAEVAGGGMQDLVENLWPRAGTHDVIEKCLPVDLEATCPQCGRHLTLAIPDHTHTCP